jgi:flagellar hook-length control protein FliK
MAERYDEFQAVRQVSQKVQWMVRNGEGKAILRLDPPELGHIEIEVETKSGEMKIHMSVENESVKNTLEASAPQLRQSMEQHHVKIEKLEVQVEARLDAQGGQADPQKSRRSEHAQRQLRRGMKIAEVLVDIPQVDTGRRLGYNTMELIA